MTIFLKKNALDKIWFPERAYPEIKGWVTPMSVKSYVTEPSTKCYFNGFLFMRILTHDKI